MLLALTCRIVGVTEDEVEAAVAWNKKSFLSLMAKHTHNELLITDLSRSSVLDDPEISLVLCKKTEAEGSTQGLLFVEKMKYQSEVSSSKMILEIPPMVIPDLLKMLKGRIFFHRDFFLVNSVADFIVSFLPVTESTSSSWELDGNQLLITVSHELALQLQAGLMPEIGDYCFPDLHNFTLRIIELSPQ